MDKDSQMAAGIFPGDRDVQPRSCRNGRAAGTAGLDRLQGEEHLFLSGRRAPSGTLGVRDAGIDVCNEKEPSSTIRNLLMRVIIDRGFGDR